MSKRNIMTILTTLFIMILCVSIFKIVLKPVIVSRYIVNAAKFARGRFVCTLDNQGRHVGKLYKINNGKKTLVRTTVSNSCIFSRPKINAGFFVFAIGGGGGATPYEGGNNGQIISKHIPINNPVIVIKIGRGGSGTFVDKDKKFIDSKNGEATEIEALNIIAKGGSKSTRMTPLGTIPDKAENYIPEKYHYLYDIPKSVKYGRGGDFDKHITDTSAKAPSGHSGALIIQW